ncbi:MAG: ABC transporter permease, partial [Cyanobacteria bacterium J06576_12]
MDLATMLSTSWGRIWTIARNVFLEVVRDRILYVVGVFGIVMVMAITLLPEVAASPVSRISLSSVPAATSGSSVIAIT